MIVRLSSAAVLGLALFMSPVAADAQAPKSIMTPESVNTKVGTLSFQNGTPSAETSAAVYDHLDFTYAFRAFTDTFKGVSIQAVREGFEAAGIKDNEVLIFSELMDAGVAVPDGERRHRVLPKCC